MRHVFALMCIGAVLALAACASVPPPTETIAEANLALGKAEQADAQRDARLQVYQAREKLQEAQRAVDRKENLQARRLAESALVEAQLAEATADAARAQRNVAEIRRNIEALQSETERSLGR